MKVSKRIVIIFISVTLISTCAYFIFGILMVKSFSKNEVKRAGSITNTVVQNLNKEVKDIDILGDVYKDDISKLIYLKEKYPNENIDKDISIDERLRKDKINYKFIMYLDKEEMKIGQTIEDEDYNEVVEISRDIIKKSKQSKVTGIITTNLYPYAVNINAIDVDNDKKIEMYLVLLKRYDKEQLLKMQEEVRRKIEISDTVPEDDSIDYSLYDEENILFQTKGTTIKSYYIIPKIRGYKDFALSVTEPRYVEMTAASHVGVLVLILIIIGILANFILYNLIKNKVVNRVQKISESVNNIIETANTEQVLEIDSLGDEITELTRDINGMLFRIVRASTSLEKNEEKYSNLVKSMTNGYIYLRIEMDDQVKAYDAIVLEMNYAAQRILKLTNESVINKRLSKLLENISAKSEEVLGALYKLSEENYSHIEQEVNLLDNVWVSISMYALEKGYLSIIITDITDIKKYSEEMKYLASYDTLTSLLNRHKLNNYLMELSSKGEEFSIIFIDLDNFKNLNDTLGHNVGDGVLCVVAEVLNSLSNENTTIARFGGDEFIIVRKGKNDMNQVTDLTNNVLYSLNRSFKFKNYVFQLKASAGISFYPQHSKDISTLLKYSDIAMYESKALGGNRFKFFEENMLSEIEIENKLRTAIEKGEFEVYFQPIYDVHSHKVSSAEALIRWFTDEGMIPPDKFIGIAKRSGDIIDIDNFVLREACKFCKENIKSRNKKFNVSINISQKSLKQENFIINLKELLKQYELEPRSIKLEITEDEIIEDPNATIEILNKIREIGVKIALDDFGIGYSSFNYIKTLPLDVIKIDRSLLISLEEDDKTLAIIETLINLCHMLNLEVVCEGVEVECQLQLLKDINCDKIQGYYISRPLAKGKFREFMEEN